jgi:bifunctional NMN adenylyltransferase/nudix hydrolase
MKTGIIIGRFQPLHNAHAEMFEEAIQQVDRLIVVVGSATQAKTIKNPWTSDERSQMIMEFFEGLGKEAIFKVSVVSVRDYLYNDNLWLAEVQSTLSQLEIDQDEKVILFGHKKDSSTFYLDLFPRMEFVDLGSKGDLSATMVRELFFEGRLGEIKRHVPEFVAKRLFEEATQDIGSVYSYLCEEYKKIAEYRAMWKGTPYPVVFVTADAIVVKSGHVLVVRRKFAPGRGLIALPGGFINPKESIKASSLRELKEETRIAVRKEEIAKHLVSSDVFDHPGRSLRGRTITHAFHYDLGRGDLPRVKGDDDADEAWWMPIREVLRREEQFFEDHFHIIYHFLLRA